MEVKHKPFYNSLKRYWRRRSYQRLHHNEDNASSSKKKIKSVKFATSRRFWRIKPVPKLRIKIGSSSSSAAAIQKLWTKFKKAYMQMMINFSGKMWYSGNRNIFEAQRIPKVGKGSTVYSAMDEFENRLVYEIYKSVLEARQLSSIIN